MTTKTLEQLLVDVDGPANIGEVIISPNTLWSNSEYSIIVMDGEDELNGFSHYEYQIYKKINGTYVPVIDSIYTYTEITEDKMWERLENGMLTTLKSEGEYYIVFRPYDELGNVGEVSTAYYFNIDVTEPTASVYPNIPANEYGWHKDAFTLALS